MSVSEWERKRTLDKMFMHVPPHQRAEFLERVKKEQDKMDNGKDTVSVKAPKKPAFLKKKKEQKKSKTDMANGGGDDVDNGDDVVKETPCPGGKIRSKGAGRGLGRGQGRGPIGRPTREGIYEVLTAQLGAVTPRPMMVNTLPGTEFRGDQSHTEITSPGGDDGHTHEANYDSAGNGSTLPDDTGHQHDVRSFIVVDYQSPDGGMSHGHPGQLSNPETTPGSEFKPYLGIV